MWSQQGGWTSGGWSRAVAAGGGALLSLDFTTGSLPSGATASGGANGTRTNSSGNITTSSAPRFDYTSGGVSRGILVEAAATNLILGSNSIDQVPWANAGNTIITPSAASSPDGTVNAFKLDSNGTANTHRRYQLAWSSAQTGTFSIHAKAAEYNFAYVGIYDGGNYVGAVFNLTTGVVTSTSGTLLGSSSVSVGGGWWRLSVTLASPAGYCTMSPSDTATPAFDTGSPTFAGSNGSGVYFYGAQAESGTVASTYIPTTSAAVTRTADAIGITVPSGGSTLSVTFDDNSSQNIGVTPGSYTLTTSLTRPRVKTIVVT